MLDWIKTTQAIVATVAALFATMLAWWNLGLPRLVFAPEQMSDTQPIALNSAALGIGRHVSGIADPFTAISTSSASPTSSAPTAGSRPPGTV